MGPKSPVVARSSAALSVRAIKEAAAASQTMPLQEAFRTRFVWEEKRMHSADAQEGPLAFVEKRPPPVDRPVRRPVG
ncbi:hypothetical protein ACFVUH_36555 [Kitasatospora sp. NPDC058032]|uniref:hypothetical protein n=1 Tax=Kitasatospora sp. NPDC058032 TaxID=3346307 RepID=UPI0036DC4E4D